MHEILEFKKKTGFKINLRGSESSYGFSFVLFDAYLSIFFYFFDVSTIFENFNIHTQTIISLKIGNLIKKKGLIVILCR
jgi:hypothetical protein